MMRTFILWVLSDVVVAQQAVSIVDMLKSPSSPVAAPAAQTGGGVQYEPQSPTGQSSVGDLLGRPGNQLVNPTMQPPMPATSQSPLGAMGNVVQSLMGSAGSESHSSSRGSQKESVESQQIVAGLVEAFMHKQSLLPGEKACLENSVSQITSDLVGTCKDIVFAIKSLIGGNFGQPAQSQSGVSPGLPGSKASSGNLVSDGIDGAMKITSLVTLSTSLVKSCVQGDALKMLNETAHHLIDMKYLGHRLLVSGVDIAHYLSDSIISYESHQYHRFGADIGTSLRKILLSKNNTGARLPEGVPEQDIIQETTEGIMDGFFTQGSDVEITDSARPDVDINLDLHACIAGNQPFFKEIFLALWNAIAQLSLNGAQHGLQPAGQVAGASQQWTGELMVALMQLPSALQRCNVGEETQDMLLEAIQTLPQLKVHVEFPAATVKNHQGDEIAERMAKAVEAWTNWDFKRFGDEIGIMLREFVLMTFPQKYSVDKDGRLRRQLESFSQQTTVGFIAPLIGGVGVALFMAMTVGLAALRSYRSTTASYQSYRQSSEAEFALKEECDVESASREFLREQLVE